MVNTLDLLEKKIGLHENVDIRRVRSEFIATFFEQDEGKLACDAAGQTIPEAIHNLQCNLLGVLLTPDWQSLEHLETITQGSIHIHIYYVVTGLAAWLYDDGIGEQLVQVTGHTIEELLVKLQRRIA